MNEYEAMVTYVKNLLTNPGSLQSFAAGPIDDVAVNLGDEPYGDVNPLDILSEALAETDLDPSAQEAVMAAASASASAAAGGAAASASASASATATAEGEGYSIEQLAAIFAEGIKVTIEDNDVITNIDNSFSVQGDVHGNVHQDNDTNVVNADDGAVAAGGDQDGQFQTGDGQQIGQSHGVANQGDNSGQQAGHDATADNVTSGDDNTVASDGAIIGNENVQAHDITGSEFGQGNLTDDDSFHATDSYNSQDDNSHTHTSSDDDHVNVDVDVNAEATVEQGYPEAKLDYDWETPEEPVYEEKAHVYEDEADVEMDLLDS